MRFIVATLLSLLLTSCGTTPPTTTYTGNTEVIVTYNGKEVSRRGSRYIGEPQLRALLDRGEELIVVFSADWCEGCRVARVALERAKLKTKIHYINIDEPWAQKLAATMGIKNIPLMFHIGKDSEIIATRLGPGAIVVYLIVRY